MKSRKGPRRIFHLPRHTHDLRGAVDDELRFHIRERAERLVEDGWSPAEAEQEALRRFGNQEHIRDECQAIGRARKREMKMRETMGSILQDIRFSIRALRGQPTFTAFAVGSLGLGIAVNIVVFTLFYTVLFDPLPYPDGDRLLFVEETSPAWRIDRMGFSYPDLVDFQERNGSFSHLAGFVYSAETITGQGAAERVSGYRVSATFLETLGVQPTLGRGFFPEDEGEGAEPVILISAGLWQRRFGGSPDVNGQVISLGGQPATIIGVLPAGFNFPDVADIWAPFRANRTEFRGRNSIGVVGRLNPGTLVADAEADLNRIAVELGETHWGSTDALGIRIMTLRSWLLGDWTSPVLAFYAVVCLVLLLACANVANLLMARNTIRRKEMGVRASLGAGRIRILRQLITEGITLTALGAMVGVLLGVFGRDLLLGLSPVDLPPYLSFDLHLTPLLIISGIIVSCGLLFSLGPAISGSKPDVADTLRSEGTRGSTGAGGVRLRSAIVALEVATALVVLIGGGLMFKSLIRQINTDPGFDPSGVVSLRLDIAEARYPDPASLQDLFRRIQEEVGSIPGITGAALSTDLPTGRMVRDGNTYAEGEDLGEAKAPIYPFSTISPGFFRTMGIPLIQGRDFSDSDALADAPQVVIVNDRFVRLHWPDEDPIGKRITRGDGPPSTEAGWATVVGVVESTFTDGLGQPIRPAIYRSIHQEPTSGIFLVARSTTDPQATFRQLRSTVHAIDPDIPVSLARTMDRALLEANWQVRFYTWLFGIFSFLAVFLASAGVYGVMSFVVESRSQEFSLRLAIGAQPKQVEGLVLRRTLVLSAAGLTAGLLVSLGIARFMSGMLYQVNAIDVQVFFLATAIMAGIALLAGYVPARRILRIDPMVSLREE